MQRESTLDLLRRKLSAIAESGGAPLDPYDVDRFLTRGSLCFYDSYLDSPPTVESVRTLVKAGVPEWPLVNKGIVNETFALLKARRERGLSTVRQARLLKSRGHPRPWSVLFVHVDGELRRLREGRRL